MLHCEVSQHKNEELVLLNDDKAVFEQVQANYFHLVVHAQLGKGARALVVPEHDDLVVALMVVDKGHNVGVTKH